MPTNRDDYIYRYVVEADGTLPGASFRTQTEDFLNALHVEISEGDESASEAIEKAEEALATVEELNATVVHKAGTETITGTKTFTAPISAPVIAQSGAGNVPRELSARFADIINVKDFGAVGDGTTDDTAAFVAAQNAAGITYLIHAPRGQYLVDASQIDVRRFVGEGVLCNTNTGTQAPLMSLFEEDGSTVQRYALEMAKPTSNSTTQALAVYDDTLYRSQDRGGGLNKYGFNNRASIVEYPLREHNRSQIDYTSAHAGDTAATGEHVLQGLGHGDGFAFASFNGTRCLYAHASAPEGLGSLSIAFNDSSVVLTPVESSGVVTGYTLSGVDAGTYVTDSNGDIITARTWVEYIGCPADASPETRDDFALRRAAFADHNAVITASVEEQAAGVIRIPWANVTATSGTYVPSAADGCVWYRHLPRVTNGNFGMSSDGKFFLFIDRIITNNIVNLDRHTYTLTVTVYRRSDVEAVLPDAITGVADCSGLNPYAVFSLPLPEEEDTEYAESGITSDGKNIYIVFCGARIVSRCLIETWTLEGQHVSSVTTGTIRDENPAIFKTGIGIDASTRWLPFRYEVEGLSFWRGKLLTASRYLFTEVTKSGGTICSWNGQNYVWTSAYDLELDSGSLYLVNGTTRTLISEVPRPSNIAYWAPTFFNDSDWNIPAWSSTVSGADRVVYQRGTSDFHHFVTCFQHATGETETVNGVQVPQEWGIDKDVWEWPAFDNALNPVATRRELVWGYNPINTHKLFPIMSTDRYGGFYTFNAIDLLKGLPLLGSKVWVDGSTVSYGTTLGRAAYSVAFDTNLGRINMYNQGSNPVLSLASSAAILRANTYPATSKTYSLGRAQNLWKEVFASTGTINTSDIRLKTDIDAIPDAVLDAWGEVDFLQFRMTSAVRSKGDAARLHTGVIAQRIKEVFEAHGLDACRYGLLCHDVWEASPAYIDQYGEVIDEAREAGDLWSIRYTECLAMEAAYQRRRADRIEARIAALEAKLS